MKNHPVSSIGWRAPVQAVAALVLALATVVPGWTDDPKDAPIPLDPLLELVGTNVKPVEFAKRFPQLKIPRLQALPEITGYTRIGRAEGRGITLFGISVDTANIRIAQREGTTLSVMFLDRGTGVKLPRPAFEKLLTDCTAAVTAHTGIPYVEKSDRPGASQPGAMETRFRLWPGHGFKMVYSYSIEDPARQIPFRAEWIRLAIGDEERP